MPEERKKLTIPDLAARKKAGEKVVMASIPDYPSAVWAERAGIDIAAVGDSLGMVSYGYANTLPVTIDMMIAHAQAVRRGAPNCMILVAMTYGSYATPESGVANALRLMKEGGADVVKMQGGKDKAHIIRAIADAGVPVMSHVGMCPHFVHQYGGFKLQGRTAAHGLRVRDHHVDGDRQGVGVSVAHHAEAVAHRGNVDSRPLGPDRGRIVRDRRHDHLLAGLLARGEIGNGQLFPLVRHGTRSLRCPSKAP